MMDAIVVGSGLFGSIIARHLALSGVQVGLMGDNRAGTASLAAGCVLRPSWAVNMSNNDVEAALALLHLHYPVEEKHLMTHPGRLKRIRVWHIYPQDILTGNNALQATVRSIEPGLVHTNDMAIPCRWIIVCTGIWGEELVAAMPRVEAKYGMSIRAKPVSEEMVSIWAPYRQVVAINMKDGCSWIGDGTAVKAESLTEARIEASRARMLDKAGLPRQSWLSSCIGARPYIKGLKDPCYLAIDPITRVVVANGGAKNGTMAAAWAARRIAEVLK